MAAKSRYQLRDRGRKGEPCWTVEDDQQGKEHLYSSRIRSNASGYLTILRQYERDTAARLKLGYHLPGL